MAIRPLLPIKDGFQREERLKNLPCADVWTCPPSRLSILSSVDTDPKTGVIYFHVSVGARKRRPVDLEVAWVRDAFFTDPSEVEEMNEGATDTRHLWRRVKPHEGMAATDQPPFLNRDESQMQIEAGKSYILSAHQLGEFVGDRLAALRHAEHCESQLMAAKRRTEQVSNAMRNWELAGSIDPAVAQNIRTMLTYEPPDRPPQSP